MDGRDAELLRLLAHEYRFDPLTVIAAFLGGVAVAAGWLWHKVGTPHHH